MRFSFLISFFLFSLSLPAATDKYFVAFQDKDNSQFSLDRPEEFLSLRSLERRQKQGIALTGHDLPVSSGYLSQLNAAGARICSRLRWLNGCVVEVPDSPTLERVKRLVGVKEVWRIAQAGIPSAVHKLEPVPSPAVPAASSASQRVASFNYGFSYNQVHMINCDYLHDSGYDGTGIVIAVLDAGFLRVDSLAAFDSIRIQNKILSTWDFVDNETEVYNDNSHGMSVLSCMASNIPGTLVGTAPGASFHLLRSEDVSSETLAEEFFWAAAAEYADSAGADIITSSLGYTTFDDPLENHTYADMDGHTTVAALAANHAASAGMLVVCSAGNLGASFWNYISTPADADSALAVGAVDPAGAYANFSGNGPSADGEVKPNVAVQGEDTYVYFPGGFAAPGNGTSFAAPILAGAAACLWQAYDTLGNMALKRTIEESSSQYTFPDTLVGYGIPNFMSAFTLLQTTTVNLPAEEGILQVYPVPWQEQFHVIFNSYQAGTARARIYDVLGKEILSEEIKLQRGLQNLVFQTDPLGFGAYFFELTIGDAHFTKLLMAGKRL